MSSYESHGASGPTRTIAALRELIGALDRRTPHMERMGEIRIVRDAALLRSDAVARIEELKQLGIDHGYDAELVHAVMTDDGAPAPETVSDARS
jgi:hypothetical protein